MNVRHPKYNGVGTIDCEVEHPHYGWIPFTASPDDAEADVREVYAALVAGDYGAIAEPDPVPVEVLIRNRLQRNNAAYTQATEYLTGDYPQLEKDTWATQDTEAAAWIASPGSAVTPWIDKAASERGIEREEYIRRTVIKARQFKVMSAFLTGRRQKYEDQIKAGGDPTLDFALTPEVQMELYMIQQTVMNTAAADLQGALA